MYQDSVYVDIAVDIVQYVDIAVDIEFTCVFVDIAGIMLYHWQYPPQYPHNFVAVVCNGCAAIPIGIFCSWQGVKVHTIIRL